MKQQKNSLKKSNYKVVAIFAALIFVSAYLLHFRVNQIIERRSRCVEIKGASMQHGYQSGQFYKLVTSSSAIDQIKRGDVIQFRAPLNTKIEYIKRVIALPGDSVMIKGSDVMINGQIITEKYISAPTLLFDSGVVKEGKLITINPDNLFVMGDNRPRSSDSRDYGPIKKSSITGILGEQTKDCKNE